LRVFFLAGSFARENKLSRRGACAFTHTLPRAQFMEMQTAKV
jgi:hypothetical protein